VDDSEPEQNRAWVARGRDAAAELDRIKTEELRALTQEESGRVFILTRLELMMARFRR
jgi:hypothetical protein